MSLDPITFHPFPQSSSHPCRQHHPFYASIHSWFTLGSMTALSIYLTFGRPWIWATRWSLILLVNLDPHPLICIFFVQFTFPCSPFGSPVSYYVARTLVSWQFSLHNRCMSAIPIYNIFAALQSSHCGKVLKQQIDRIRQSCPAVYHTTRGKFER